jgi:hypothetical protein
VYVVKRRRFPVGERPTRRPLPPEAAGAVFISHRTTTTGQWQRLGSPLLWLLVKPLARIAHFGPGVLGRVPQRIYWRWEFVVSERTNRNAHAIIAEAQVPIDVVTTDWAKLFIDPKIRFCRLAVAGRITSDFPDRRFWPVAGIGERPSWHLLTLSAVA